MAVPDLHRRALAAGARAVVNKPYDSSSLAQALAGALEARATQLSATAARLDRTRSYCSQSSLISWSVESAPSSQRAAGARSAW